MAQTLGILLAAGAGRRMGRPKALVVGDDGLPWVVSASRVLAAGGCAEVIVVVGAEARRASQLLADEPVDVIVADDWDTGMSSSLRAGLGAAVSSSAEAALIHLVDLPDVGSDVIRRLVAQSAPDALARATYGEGPGHPVLLGRSHWATVMAQAAGDQGAKTYLAGHGTLLVDCSDLAGGLDRDTPEVDQHAQHPR